MNAGSLSRE